MRNAPRLLTLISNTGDLPLGAIPSETRIMRLALSVLLVAGLTTHALAQTGGAGGEPPSDEGGRYQLERSDDGFIRLDTRTGAVSNCRQARGDLVCQSSPDDRRALEAEIERLAEENAELRQRLAGGQTDNAMPEVRRDEDGRPSVELKLPNQEDVDRIVDFFGGVMQRFLEMVQNLRNDFAERG